MAPALSSGSLALLLGDKVSQAAKQPLTLPSSEGAMSPLQLLPKRTVVVILALTPSKARTS